MHTFPITALALSALAVGVMAEDSSSSSQTIKIEVGEGGLQFDPSSTTANVGDTLEYHFYGAKHSVIQGNYDSPCTPSSSSAFYSGVVQGTSSGDVTFPPRIYPRRY
jgi:plastocyanin